MYELKVYYYYYVVFFSIRCIHKLKFIGLKYLLIENIILINTFEIISPFVDKSFFFL